MSANGDNCRPPSNSPPKPFSSLRVSRLFHRLSVIADRIGVIVRSRRRKTGFGWCRTEIRYGGKSVCHCPAASQSQPVEDYRFNGTNIASKSLIIALYPRQKAISNIHLERVGGGTPLQLIHLRILMGCGIYFGDRSFEVPFLIVSSGSLAGAVFCFQLL